MQIAETGDIIEFKGGMQGRVQKVNQNSVIVDITIMENFRELDMEPLTVVSHKTILSLIKMHIIIERKDLYVIQILSFYYILTIINCFWI